MAQLQMVKKTTIDDALESAGFGIFNWFIIIFSGLMLNNVVLESVGISFVLPVLECDLNLTYQQRGILGAVGFIGIMASSHLWGFLADTTGRKRIMLPALLLGFAITIISSFSHNFEMLALMRFLNGIVLSAGSATVFAYLGEFHCQRYRNRALLSAAFISAFSAIFFPIMALLLINQNWTFHLPFLNIEYKPWRSYMLGCGIPGFICALMLLYLPESPKFLLTVGRQEEAKLVLKHILNSNKGSISAKKTERSFDLSTLIADEDVPINSKLINSSKNAISALFFSMWHQTAPLFMREHLKKTFLASLIQFIIFFTAHGVYMWFPHILNSVMQFTQRYSSSLCLCEILEFTQSANFSITDNEKTPICVQHLEISTYKHTIMLEIIYVVCLLGISYGIGKFGRKPILFAILLVNGCSGILALVIKLPLLGIYFFVILLCCGLGTTVVNAIVVDIFPTNLRAMAVCISLMAGRIGSVTGSNLLGALIDNHCKAALYCAAGSIIAAGFLSVLLPNSKSMKNKHKERE